MIRMIRMGPVILAVVVGLAAAADAQAPKPVVVVQSGEAATLDWHMHCDKTPTSRTGRSSTPC